jgi:hypothetical protein
MADGTPGLGLGEAEGATAAGLAAGDGDGAGDAAGDATGLATTTEGELAGAGGLVGLLGAAGCGAGGAHAASTEMAASAPPKALTLRKIIQFLLLDIYPTELRTAKPVEPLQLRNRYATWLWRVRDTSWILNCCNSWTRCQRGD